MFLISRKPTLLVIASIITTIFIIISVVLLSSLTTTTVLALSNSLISSNINGAFTGWVNQCVQAKLANNNNNNNSSVPRAIANPTFALANARASCTQLLQGHINSSNQLTTQNQPTSSTTDPPTFPKQYQNPSSYPYLLQQQQSQAANTPAQQYPYQSPYQYPYQQQPYPSTSQQQSPATNNAAVPPTSQYPYQNSYPYQQPQQNQSSSLPTASNPSQSPYQELQQQQNQSSALATNPSQPQSFQSFTTAQPSQSSLIIVTHVNVSAGSNNNVNEADPANLTQVVENAYTNPDGYTYVFHYMKGSQTNIRSICI